MSEHPRRPKVWYVGQNTYAYLQKLEKIQPSPSRFEMLSTPHGLPRPANPYGKCGHTFLWIKALPNGTTLHRCWVCGKEEIVTNPTTPRLFVLLLAMEHTGVFVPLAYKPSLEAIIQEREKAIDHLGYDFSLPIAEVLEPHVLPLDYPYDPTGKPRWPGSYFPNTPSHPET